ncbi:nitrous oxide-stimulated promoter family protein [Vibrio navarrensis]|uniref:nitrous oxide-stimulated promoter family protein n=1 Tax=Vibrio navarrensis TaxID=29495 RepID=UPI00057E4D33|nr:nitrous oxide-stimulated promoter family protein [Vibrio navarrensis]
MTTKMKQPPSPSLLLTGSLATEFKTVSYMVAMYCQAHHQSERVLCQSCQALLDYAETRLDRCPYGQAKPACNRCPIHCYKPEPKTQMRDVMRYGGPRMLIAHPILAIRHLWSERKPVPGKPAPESSNRHQRMAKKSSLQ